MVQSVAFAPPVRVAALRGLRLFTRMATTALVLVVGLNGLTAPAPADPLSPVSAVRAPAVFRITPGPVDAPADLPPAGSPGAATRTASTVAWAGAGTADSPAPHPRLGSAAPATGVPARHVDADRTVARTVATVVPPADPGRESGSRRGPPRA